MFLDKQHLEFNAGRAFVAVLLAAVLGVSVGCANTESSGPSVNTFGSAAVVGGAVHGGQQPIAFATVKLYAAGTTGYGSASTLLATTTSADGSGNFIFTKSSTNGPSSGSGTTWACPATTADPQIYLIATGGNTIGNHLNDAADTNSAIGLMAVMGACSTIGANSFTIVDEESTTTAVFALAQYINPGTAPGTESIGTNGANIPTGKPQGALGLNNAVASTANLTSTPVTYAGTGTASAISVTATAESAKIATIADILAACVNNQTAPNTSCTQLFTAATQPPTATVTSQPATTFQTAQDTIQAEYYMATNPIDAGGAGSSTNRANLFSQATATSPFQPTLASQPTDWTIGVTYKSTGTCTGGAAFFAGPAHAAIDASGNVWFINASASKAIFGEMSPVGEPLACIVTSQTYGTSIAIDTTGNVWADYDHATLTGLIEELPYGTTTAIAWTPPASPSSIAADGNGNVFYTNNATGGTLYELIDPGTTTTPFAPIAVTTGLNGTATTTFSGLAADSLGRIWAATSNSTYLYGAYPLTAPITAYQVTSNVVTFTATNTFTVGQVASISGLSTASGIQFNGQKLTIAAASASTFSASLTTANVALTSDTGTATEIGNYTDAATYSATNSSGVAVDANNYIYSGTICCGSTAANFKEAEKYTPAVSAVAGKVSASAQYLGGMNGAEAVVVDGAANMWITNIYPETGTSPSIGAFGVTEIAASGAGTSATFTALSPTGTALATTACTSTIGCPTGGGFQKADFLQDLDLEIDPSGNVWLMNSGTSASIASGASITEIVGAAVPVVTPLSIAAKNGTLGTKP